MALLFVDGVDSYTADTDILSKWDGVDTTDITFGSTLGRFGNGGFRMTDDVTHLQKNIPLTGATATTDELMVSISIKTENFPPTTDDLIIQFVSPENTDQICLAMSSAGTLNVRRGGSSSSPLIGSSSGGVMQDKWQRVEMMVVIADSPNGSVKVVVDGVTEIDLSSIDTKATSGDTDGSTMVQFGGPNTSGGWLLDDFVIHVSSGDAPTALLGDLEVQTLRPNGTGDRNESTAVGAATRYQAVDETGVNDGDTTYVSMSNAGDRDLYAAENLTGSPTTVHAVVVNNVCRTDGSDSREITAFVKENVTEGQAATKTVPNGAGYLTVQSYFPENPDTAAAWSASEVDGMQIGQKVVT